jgi:hypothetical protein
MAFRAALILAAASGGSQLAPARASLGVPARASSSRTLLGPALLVRHAIAPRSAAIAVAGRGPIALLARTLQSPAVSLGVSSVLLSALVGNRFVLEEVANSQSRSDLLATGAAASLVLHALATLEIDSRIAEPQQLVGERVATETDVHGRADAGRLEPFLSWLGDALLASTPTSSVLIYDRNAGRTLLRVGVMGAAAAVEVGPILDKCLTVDRARGTYLASLQNYPGKVEFAYLPPNTQCVLVQPFGDGAGAIILGANAPRIYTNKHLTWVQLLADRLGSQLGEV